MCTFFFIGATVFFSVWCNAVRWHLLKSTTTTCCCLPVSQSVNIEAAGIELAGSSLFSWSSCRCVLLLPAFSVPVFSFLPIYVWLTMSYHCRSRRRRKVQFTRHFQAFCFFRKKTVWQCEISLIFILQPVALTVFNIFSDYCLLLLLLLAEIELRTYAFITK